MTATPRSPSTRCYLSSPRSLRKRLNNPLFGYSMPQLGDDDILLSTRLFIATQHILWQEPPHVKT